MLTRFPRTVTLVLVAAVIDHFPITVETIRHVFLPGLQRDD
jgi:hypothetical protein